MTREEKCILAIEKGFTYDEITGKIYGIKGKEITRKSFGYIDIGFSFNKKHYHLRGHQFAYYIKYGKVVEQIDHKDGDRSNNKIDNLREVNNQQNHFNETKAKGYYLHKNTNKYMAQLRLNGKHIYLGHHNTEQEARKAYLDAKKIYHII